MPYGLIMLVVVVATAGRFIVASDASIRSKSLVAFVCATSILLPLALPQWHLASLLAQVVLVIVLVLHSKVHG